MILRIIVVVLLAGCLSPSPEQEAEDALGNVDHCVAEPGEDDEDECGSPFHRPGQPCLVCHSEAHNPGEKIFALAGTVYRRASDTVGLGGALVNVMDAAGNTVIVPTNSAGNFSVRDGHSRLDIDAEDGEAKVPFVLTYPLQVTVAHAGTFKVMRSLIWREGSCATCHQASEGPASTGRIFIEEEL